MPGSQLCCFRKLVLGSVLLFSVAGLVEAQIDRATLTGTVTDPSGAVISSAMVQAVAQQTGLQMDTKTNANGLYRVPGLAVGTYSLTVSRSGFETVQVRDVVLTVGETRTMNIRLKVGMVAEKVTVEAAAPLEQTSPEVSGVINNQQIQSLPINGRNWASLLLLAPMAIDDGGGDQRTIRFAGRARDDNNYTMDGVDATGIQEQAQKSTTRLQVSEDAIQEYRVSSALYTAEHGGGAGGQVDLVTKTGTNEFQGSVFEYFRNSVLDSRSFNDFNAFTNQPIVPPFRLNQFGGTFGGPIVKDNTFFFFSYEGLRQFQGRTLTAFVPSVPLRNAILTTSPAMSPIISAYAIGNENFGVCNNPQTDPCIDEFVHQGASTINEDSFLVRLDHKFTPATSLYARATRDLSIASAPLNNLFDVQQVKSHPANYVLALEHTFSPHLFNEAKFGINRAPFHNPQVSVLPYAVNTDQFEPLGNPATDNEVGTTFSWIDNLSIMHGRHTFKTGIEVRRVRLNQGFTEDDNYNFTASSTLNSNQVLIDDQLNSIQARKTWCCRGLRHTFVMPYFEDEWKVRPNLTLNLGLRWEYYSVITEPHDRMTIFDPTCTGGFIPNTTIAVAGLCPPGSPAYFPNYRNFDPRIGIAWAPKALNDKTVVRAGFGIHHGAGQNDDLNASLESNTTRINLGSNDVPGLTFPADLNSLFASHQFSAPRALARHRRDLYVENWGLSVQHEFPKDLVFQASYLGTHGVRLFARNYENLCFFESNPCVRPLPNFGPIDVKRDVGTSRFEALQLSLQRHFTKGWMLASQYMWSHSMNDGSVGGGEANAPENANCMRCDWGPSIYDTRHNVTVTSAYDLPIGPGRQFLNHSGFLGKVLGGWSLSGIGLWHTGHPLTVVAGLDCSVIPDGNCGVNQRPDLVPGVPLTPPGGQTATEWINPAAFAVAPLDANGFISHFGDEPRGIIRAPHVWQVDMGLTKDTRLTERTTLEFRAEAFNVFNHVQLGDPSQLDILGGTGFGQINTTVNFNNNNDNFTPGNTGTGLPRQIEFMLRVKF